jgi:hypothetical protein
MYNLSDIINNAIDLKFEKLNTEDKTRLKEYVLKISNLLIFYYGEDVKQQLFVNNQSDIYSLIVLLLPYFDLNSSNNIKNLSEIISGNENSRISIDTTFYIDHAPMKTEIYLKNSFKLIEITLFKTAHKLMPNWINIFPLKMENYLNNEISINLTKLYLSKSFSKDNLKMQYTTLYGCCVNFLYNDVKTIKWIIYDIIHNNKLLPTVIYLGEILNYRNFSKPYYKLTTIEIQNFENAWSNVKNNNDAIFKIKSMLLFYYRFNSHKYDFIKSEIFKIFKKNIELSQIEDIELDVLINYYVDDSSLLNVLQYLITSITTEEIYIYIYKSIQQLKYTLYGYFCLNDNVIKPLHEYLTSYLGNFLNLTGNNNALFYLSPKIIYNYFKNLVCNEVDDQYIPYTNSADWNELPNTKRNDFIDKLNKNTLNIPKNYEKLYSSFNNYKEKYNELKIFIETSNIIPKCIYYCLCYNGILTEFVYNKDLIDERKMPNKSINENLYEQHIISRIVISGRNFINNIEYSEESKNIIIKTKWFLRFGSNWICQLQQFHHFLHNRVMFITGGTGSGKSTIFPMVMLYSYKAFLFLNNYTIYDTQPRIKPTQENAMRISQQLGFILKDDNINYIQFSTGDKKNENDDEDDKRPSKIIDDEYHPCLRFYTDKSIIKTILNNPILKYIQNNACNPKNIVDMILIDESHENNTNMTIILTILKFAVYINNSLSIGMVSATMEYDEQYYRNFYKIIDDNYKYPLDIFLKNDQINRSLMDRRIHMSKPFGTTNYKITDIIHTDTSISEDENIYNILKKILNKKEDNKDIIIFKNGQNDIKKLIAFLNEKDLPRYACILPFYSELTKYQRDVISKINDPKIREQFKNPPKTDPFDKTIPFNKKISYTYTQFIIIATNIAEASLTIETLKYVIDTGKHKINIYNLNTFQNKLVVQNISKQNQVQRRGRVGRTQAGVVYYTYDYNKLKNEPLYKIQIEDYKNIIYELYTDSNHQLITPKNDPNLITNPDRLLDCYKYQYIISNYKLFNYPKINTSDITPIYYPYDGKYHSFELIDPDNNFYITNPTPYIIDNNFKIAKLTEQPNNVMKITFDYLTSLKMFEKQSENNYIITIFGKTIYNILNLYEIDNKIELTDLFCILHSISIQQKHQKLYEYLIHNIIIKIIFSSNSFMFNIDTKIKNIKNEFEYKSKFIPSKYYNLYSTHFNNINVSNDSDLLYSINNIINTIDFEDDHGTYLNTFIERKDFYKKFLTYYYYHLVIITHISNNKLKYGLTYDFLKSFKTDFLCFYRGELKNDIIFQCLMIKYSQYNIIRKYDKNHYVFYKIKNVSPNDEIMTLNTYSFVINNNYLLYLTKNDNNEVSNLMVIDEWLLKRWK